MLAPGFLWIFGSAVQDVAVDIDLDRLSREHNNLFDLLRLEEAPEMLPGLWLTTRIGTQRFAVSIRIKRSKDVKVTKKGFYLLQPGGKYTLSTQIVDSAPSEGHCISVTGNYASWGGGGPNVATFIRAISPAPDVVPIKYTDVAVTDTFRQFEDDVRGIAQRFQQGDSVARDLTGSVGCIPAGTCAMDPQRQDAIREQLGQFLVKYLPETSLETFLATLRVKGVLYVPRRPSFRRNLVLSRIRSTNREVDDKIIFRGRVEPLPAAEEHDVTTFLQHHASGVSAIMLNSLKDGPLFKAAYHLYKRLHRRDRNMLGILAMTEPMQQFTRWMVGEAKGGSFPPHILVLNAKEAYRLAERLSGDVEEFMKSENDLPDVMKFGRIMGVILRRFPDGNKPRIYVTLGSQGSLGVDTDTRVLYVRAFAKPRARVYDTNACGDAYCAAIGLLEWAKRNGYEDLVPSVGSDNPESPYMEMIYFMAVATAAAYCRATNRHGRVDAIELKDLLEHSHLAYEVLDTTAFNLAGGVRPLTADASGRLGIPRKALAHGLTKGLAGLMSVGQSSR
jgi:hypothetical protein